MLRLKSRRHLQPPQGARLQRVLPFPSEQKNGSKFLVTLSRQGKIDWPLGAKV